MVSLFRSDRDKDKTKSQSQSQSQSRPSDNGGTPDRPPPRQSEDGGLGEASSSATTSPTPPPPVSTPSKYRILRRKASVKSPGRGTASAPVASSPPPLPPPRLASPLSTDGVRRDSTEPESSTSVSGRSGPSEPPTASTFASLASQQDDAVSAAAAAAALGLTDDFIASPSGRRISEASKREGRVFGLPPRLPDLSTDDEAGPVGWRGAGGSLDMGSRTDNTLFDPDWTPKPPSLDPAAAGGVTFPTALSPPRRPMPRSPRPPPRSEAIHSPRKRLTDSDSSSPQLSPAFAAAKGSPSRSGPSNDGIRFSTAEWLSRPPNKASSGRKGSMGGEDPFSRTAADSPPPPSSSSTSRRSGTNHGRSTSVSALSAMAQRNLGLHDDSGTSSESAEEFGSDVGASRLLSPVGYTAPSPLGGYEVEVSCADTRGTNDEIKWEITVRRRRASSPGGDAADGIHRPAPLSASSPLQLGPSGHAVARAPASASSLNLSLALDQPSGKLVFISIPMALDPAASTPRSSGHHRRNGSRASPSPRPVSSSARSSPVPDGLPPQIPSRLSSATTAAAVPAPSLDADSSRPSTPPPAPHPASTATLPVTPVSKRREGSHIYDRAFASPRTPGGAPHTPSRVLHYISPAAEASTLSSAGRGVSLQHSALSKRRPSGSIANAARRSSLDGISGGVSGGVGGGTGLSQAAPMSPSAPGQRRSRIVSAEELAGGLFAAGTVDQFSEQLEEPLSIRLKDP